MCAGGAYRPFLARPAFQRRLQFPDRRIARAPDGVGRGAGAGLNLHDPCPAMGDGERDNQLRNELIMRKLNRPPAPGTKDRAKLEAMIRSGQLSW
jgi:hypothetical protein